MKFNIHIKTKNNINIKIHNVNNIYDIVHRLFSGSIKN